MNKVNRKPAPDESEATVPTDLGKALASAPIVKTKWKNLTPIARRDFISWIDSVKQVETRRRRDDPRPSIAERYRDRVDYAARARAAAERLAADGYLLPADVELAVHNALERYDAFARAGR